MFTAGDICEVNGMVMIAIDEYTLVKVITLPGKNGIRFSDYPNLFWEVRKFTYEASDDDSKSIATFTFQVSDNKLDHIQLKECYDLFDKFELRDVFYDTNDENDNICTIHYMSLIGTIYNYKIHYNYETDDSKPK